MEAKSEASAKSRGRRLTRLLSGPRARSKSSKNIKADARMASREDEPAVAAAPASLAMTPASDHQPELQRLADGGPAEQTEPHCNPDIKRPAKAVSWMGDEHDDPAYNPDLPVSWMGDEHDDPAYNPDLPLPDGSCVVDAAAPSWPTPAAPLSSRHYPQSGAIPRSASLGACSPALSRSVSLGARSPAAAATSSPDGVLSRGLVRQLRQMCDSLRSERDAAVRKTQALSKLCDVLRQQNAELMRTSAVPAPASAVATLDAEVDAIEEELRRLQANAPDTSEPSHATEATAPSATSAADVSPDDIYAHGPPRSLLPSRRPPSPTAPPPPPPPPSTPVGVGPGWRATPSDVTADARASCERLHMLRHAQEPPNAAPAPSQAPACAPPPPPAPPPLPPPTPPLQVQSSLLSMLPPRPPSQRRLRLGRLPISDAADAPPSPAGSVDSASLAAAAAAEVQRRASRRDSIDWDSYAPSPSSHTPRLAAQADATEAGVGAAAVAVAVAAELPETAVPLSPSESQLLRVRGTLRRVSREGSEEEARTQLDGASHGGATPLAGSRLRPTPASNPPNPPPASAYAAAVVTPAAAAPAAAAPAVAALAVAAPAAAAPAAAAPATAAPPAESPKTAAAVSARSPLSHSPAASPTAATSLAIESPEVAMAAAVVPATASESAEDTHVAVAAAVGAALAVNSASMEPVVASETGLASERSAATALQIERVDSSVYCSDVLKVVAMAAAEGGEAQAAAARSGKAVEGDKAADYAEACHAASATATASQSSVAPQGAVATAVSLAAEAVGADRAREVDRAIELYARCVQLMQAALTRADAPGALSDAGAAVDRSALEKYVAVYTERRRALTARRGTESSQSARTGVEAPASPEPRAATAFISAAPPTPLPPPPDSLAPPRQLPSAALGSEDATSMAIAAEAIAAEAIAAEAIAAEAIAAMAIAAEATAAEAVGEEAVGEEALFMDLGGSSPFKDAALACSGTPTDATSVAAGAGAGTSTGTVACNCAGTGTGTEPAAVVCHTEVRRPTSESVRVSSPSGEPPTPPPRRVHSSGWPTPIRGVGAAATPAKAAAGSSADFPSSSTPLRPAPPKAPLSAARAPRPMRTPDATKAFVPSQPTTPAASSGGLIGGFMTAVSSTGRLLTSPFYKYEATPTHTGTAGESNQVGGPLAQYSSGGGGCITRRRIPELQNMGTPELMATPERRAGDSAQGAMSSVDRQRLWLASELSRSTSVAALPTASDVVSTADVANPPVSRASARGPPSQRPPRPPPPSQAATGAPVVAPVPKLTRGGHNVPRTPTRAQGQAEQRAHGSRPPAPQQQQTEALETPGPAGSAIGPLGVLMDWVSRPFSPLRT